MGLSLDFRGIGERIGLAEGQACAGGVENQARVKGQASTPEACFGEQISTYRSIAHRRADGRLRHWR